MLTGMTSWASLAATQPAFAEHVRRTFAVRTHTTVATLRRDGSPRVSGTEVDSDDEAGRQSSMTSRARPVTRNGCRDR